ncbi:hypothetical protein [Burkholderia gladioli]|jgi:hypothetical protein|uniref:hypothetical protein n=1 Tax=Burkholderia gladioli TaxID=28095 RepID=UPI0016404A23|nr:hypothetical protein [Burkholderia gladioli]MBU9643530.1 hypothetical protein [Burkholderia gladioli]
MTQQTEPDAAITYTVNKRMPFQRFNWADHGSRMARLKPLERGWFDIIRTELWTVEGVVMDEATLRKRLRIPGKTIPKLDILIDLGLLQREGEMIFDPVQRFEWNRAVSVSEANRDNGRKGGRPSKASTGKESEDIPESPSVDF